MGGVQCSSFDAVWIGSQHTKATVRQGCFEVPVQNGVGTLDQSVNVHWCCEFGLFRAGDDGSTLSMMTGALAMMTAGACVRIKQIIERRLRSIEKESRRWVEGWLYRTRLPCCCFWNCAIKKRRL